MIKKYSLVLIVILCSFSYGFGQIVTFEFNGLVGNEVSVNSNFNDVNLSSSTITRGSGLTASNNGDRFNATSWATTSIANAVTGNDYMEFTIIPNAGYQFDVTTIVLNFQRSGTGPRGLALRSSLDSFITNIDGEKAITDNTSTQIITFNIGQANSSSSVTYKIYGWAEATGGSGGIGDGTGNDLIVNGSVTSTCTDTLDFNNLQFPATGTITVGGVFDVYAQAYEPGVTDSAGQGANIEAWIGFNTSNTDPSTWAETDWVVATYNTDVGNNDEYTLDLGAQISSPGTYYYASRFRLNNCGYTYGGFDSGGGNGTWDGTNDVSGVLTVNARILDWVNLQYPEMGNISLGNVYDVFAQVFEPGVTDTPASQGPNIEAWIGYSSDDTDPNGAGWTWVVANYNPLCGTNCGTPEENDEYFIDIGSSLPVGTYYYASRFRIDGDVFYYGGYSSDNAGVIGGFWGDTNGAETNRNGILTITLADVVITEIMYNTPSTDDEWIEICNVSGSTQDISNYIIDVGGTTEFTFPVNTTIADGTCITISLGSNGDGTYNNECPFTPDFGIGASTNDTNNLVNSTNSITLFAANGTTVADIVTYDDDDGADGNGSSLHVANAALDNSDTGTNWQEVPDGGSPGINSLVSPCSAPELQLENSSGVNQTCGAFTINFGSQATGFNTDLTFDIDNEGTLDLIVSTLVLSGTNSGDFSIVSPATPFTITSGNTQTVTVRFSPTTTGVKNATLTINNNDADEGMCTIALHGNGTTPVPEINVEGDIGTFPDILDGDTSPSSLDNTLFAAQFIGSSQAKSFRIQNIGTADLTGIVVTIGGVNPADFSVSIAPSATVTASNLTTFEITFAPLTAGVNKTAVISIANNDADENPYTFLVQGTGNCAASTITITPSSGPENTIVTVTGTNLSSATASFNGVAAIVNNISATQMEVTVPSGATTGNLEIIDNSGCPGNAAFTVIDTIISSCEGGTALTELFISEVTDATYGSLTYIELYNATGSNINLSNYEIRIYVNGNTVSFTSQTLSGTINADDTFIITTGTFGVLGNALCATSGGDGLYGDLISNTLLGVNIGTGNDDYIGLYNTTVLIDEFGVFGDDDWTSTAILTGDRGFNFRRLNTASPLPTTTFSTNDWNIIDWTGFAYMISPQELLQQ
ncbi:MAG: choice-of-anchor D domain-containing protein [Bacteroidetes bacterium]|nr:choice-of-anchor D domain-containing protein [Bacteroidota bacterium]